MEKEAKEATYTCARSQSRSNSSSGSFHLPQKRYICNKTKQNRTHTSPARPALPVSSFLRRAFGCVRTYPCLPFYSRVTDSPPRPQPSSPPTGATQAFPLPRSSAGQPRSQASTLASPVNSTPTAENKRTPRHCTAQQHSLPPTPPHPTPRRRTLAHHSSRAAVLALRSKPRGHNQDTQRRSLLPPSPPPPPPTSFWSLTGSTHNGTPPSAAGQFS